MPPTPCFDLTENRGERRMVIMRWYPDRLLPGGCICDVDFGVPTQRHHETIVCISCDNKYLITTAARESHLGATLLQWPSITRWWCSLPSCFDSQVFALLVFEMAVFCLLISPLPFTWRRKLFKFLAISPVVRLIPIFLTGGCQNSIWVEDYVHFYPPSLPWLV